MSFSFLKTFPVSAIIKASPFSQRPSTETPGLADSTTRRRASGSEENSRFSRGAGWGGPVAVIIGV